MYELPPAAHDLGFHHDLPRIVGRRGALRLFAGAGILAVAASCNVAGESSSPTTEAPRGAGSDPSAGSATDAASCSTIPAETPGPFPGNGSNGPGVLRQSGIVRRDIRSSFGSSSTVAPGLPLTVELMVQRTGDGCAPCPGAAVYP